MNLRTHFAPTPSEHKVSCLSSFAGVISNDTLLPGQMSEQNIELQVYPLAADGQLGAISGVTSVLSIPIGGPDYERGIHWSSTSTVSRFNL